MSADSSGNDLAAVGIPITGAAAYAPVDEANMVSAADGNDRKLKLSEDYPAYRKLGLFKSDGGVEDTVDGGDATEFFQEGYKLAGDATLGFTVGLAQNDTVVLEFVTGQKLDANNSMLIEDAFSKEPFMVFQETMFKNKTIRRRNGVAMITAVATDKDERGTVKGRTVTCQWLPSPLFGGAKYREWMLPAPTAPTAPSDDETGV